MTIRSAVLVGIVVLGSGGFVLAQRAVPGPGVDLPDVPVPFEIQHKTVATSPVRGQVFECRLLNLGTTNLSNPTMKFFGADGSQIDASLISENCPGLVSPGRFCTATYVESDATVYCRINYSHNGLDKGRGSMQVTAQDGPGASDAEPGVVVEAR